MEKINFQNNITKLNKETMDTFQDNIDAGLQTKQDKINVQWQSATVNSEYAQGLCSYLTLGNILIIKIVDLKVIKQVSHRTTLVSGLPSCVSTIFLMQQFDTGSSRRCNLLENGNILDWYDPIEVSDNQFYSTIITTLNN